MANSVTIQDTLIHIGDTVRVNYKVIETATVSGKTKKEKHEEKKERSQAFEGVVIAIKGSGANLMFTVRRIGVGAVGIERIFPGISPWIRKIEVKSRGKVRRAKLYYLRDQVGRRANKLEEYFVVEKTHAQTPVSAKVSTNSVS